MVAPGMNECREGQADGRAGYGSDRRGQTCYSVTLGGDGRVDVVLDGGPQQADVGADGLNSQVRDHGDEAHEQTVLQNVLTLFLANELLDELHDETLSLM